jgi:hypothetical protein
MQPKRPSYLELVSHSAMGGVLGLSLALALLMLDAQHILEMIVNSSLAWSEDREFVPAPTGGTGNRGWAES